MVERLDRVDVVTVGVGWAGSIVAKELAQDGHQVVGLERGEERSLEDYFLVHDEYKYGSRWKMMSDLSKGTLTVRHNADQRAVPLRKWGAFPMGSGVGGSGSHWSGQTFRFLPYDFQIRSETLDRYGTEKIPDGVSLQDWGVTYDEMEPYYDRFEKLCGISGEAGNLQGEIQDAGNPFQGPRSDEYPTGPMQTTPPLERFHEAGESLGYNPYMVPSGNLSEEYTNPDDITRGACEYCGFCTHYGCEWGAKASPVVTTVPVARQTGNFELRTNAHVVEVMYDEANQRVDGVRYVDTVSGQTYEQPADTVALTAYALNNVRLLLLSGIGAPYDPETGEGTLGKNYAYHNIVGGAGFFDDEKWNLYMGAGALSAAVDDWNGDNFDHSDLDFLHGGNISMFHSGAMPIAKNSVPPGTPSWGSEFKRQSIEYFNSSLSAIAQGASLPHRENYLDLDPTYTDEFGQPLLRMTFNWKENARNMTPFLGDKIQNILEEMGASSTAVAQQAGNMNYVTEQATHNTGGAIMGDDPEESVVNTHLQHWDAENLFVVGASAFPHNGGYNPTDTVGALSFRAADFMKTYL